MNIKKYSAGAILFLSLGMISATHAQSSVPWTGTWAVAPQQSTIDASFNGLAEQTLRQILHTSIGGSAARVQISNTFGQQPLTVRDVQLAQAVVDSTEVPLRRRFPVPTMSLPSVASPLSQFPQGRRSPAIRSHL